MKRILTASLLALAVAFTGITTSLATTAPALAAKKDPCAKIKNEDAKQTCLEAQAKGKKKGKDKEKKAKKEKKDKKDKKAKKAKKKKKDG